VTYSKIYFFKRQNEGRGREKTKKEGGEEKGKKKPEKTTIIEF